MRTHGLCHWIQCLPAGMTALLAVLAAGCPCQEQPQRDYRQDMRVFVQALSAYAKNIAPGFLVIPQNGEALLTLDGEPAGPPAMAYLAAIDGQGREDLFYGYDGDNEPTPAPERAEMAAFLQLGEDHGVQALVTDYCFTQAFMDDSYGLNAALGFTSFAADHRELDNIPAYPLRPFQQNVREIANLSEVRNFLYLVNPGAYADRPAFLAALAASEYDMLLIDLFFEGEALTAQDVGALREKPGGGQRLIIAYMSIGEAETYRFYWQSAWRPGAPEWLGEENPAWEGNYKVRYWDPGWQTIIYGNPNAYLDRILAAGFNGVYLDIIDAYEYYED